MPDDTELERLPLRERKKRLTRQRLADVATALFVSRGFDNVTVNEIADAADVSKVTVFKYFPRKEDLFFDRGPQMHDLLRRTIRDRPAGETPTAALHRLTRSMLIERHPLSGLGDFRRFFQTVVDSPALRDRARELAAELQDELTELLAEADSRPVDDDIRLRAAMIHGVLQTVYLAATRRVLAGERADDIADDILALADRGFATLDAAFDGGLPSPATG